MSTYRASVRVDDGTLHTSRPITAPEQVTDLIDSLTYSVARGDVPDVVSVDLTVETSGQSDTPIADSIAGTSSTPLDGQHAEQPDPADTFDAEQPAPPTSPIPS